jgi:hypothetical protein
VSVMSRRISMPVRVELDASGRPRAFTWRGVRHRVEVIGCWHLCDRWWVSPAEADWTGKGPSDRHYYRLLTRDHQVFEVYRELMSKGLWVLDIVQD